jgi:hypothetical protein
MAATAFQRQLCRLIAKSRRDSGESYVAGGVALNTLLQAPRISRDIDLFHDTNEALHNSWTDDRALLARDGYALDVIREAPAYVEAVVSKGTDRAIVQWLPESAFRFFPLVEDEDFGLVLHPFDQVASHAVRSAEYRRDPPAKRERQSGVGSPRRPISARTRNAAGRLAGKRRRLP